MADYTMLLKDLFTPNRFGHSYFSRSQVESWFMDYELSDYLTTEQIEKIQNAGMWSKEKLARKIVDHYLMREIGYETPALFQHFAKIKMKEIMEYELPVVYSNSLEYDPLESVLFDITETRNINGQGTSESSSNSSGTGHSVASSSTSANESGLTVSSDTPQTNISKTDILAGNYASETNASQADSTSSGSTTNDTQTSNDINGTTSTNSQTTEEWHHHEQGNKGVLDSYQKMLVDYRKSLVAVDKEIIEQLNDLFMGIY